MSGAESHPDHEEAEGGERHEAHFEDVRRPLDPRERYRAVNDAFDMQQELVDLGDHKARFALVIMGGLNVVAFVLVSRSDTLSSVPEGVRPWLGLYVALYALAAVYFFFQAIESLKPRIYMGAADKELPGVRFFDGILRRDEADYRRAWSEVRLSQLSEEIAEQVHIVAGINREKYAALRRLYAGLVIMTVQTAGLIALVMVLAFL